MKSNICKECLETCCYNEKYDAYFCKRCNHWNEESCSDEMCPFCFDRPKKPSMLAKKSKKS